MKNEILVRVNSFNWGGHSHPCLQDQRKIPQCFVNLLGQDESLARDAALKLWDLAAHQGNVGSSSVDLAPLLFEVYRSLKESVQVELLDVLYQFSCYFNEQDWGENLQKIFVMNRLILEKEKLSSNEDVSSFAILILEKIDELE